MSKAYPYEKDVQQLVNTPAHAAAFYFIFRFSHT